MTRRLSDWLYIRRWRLARAIAPGPIIADITGGKDGAFVITRQEGTSAMWRLDRFRLRSWLAPSIAEARDNGKAFGDFSRFQRRYFVGRVGR